MSELSRLADMAEILGVLIVIGGIVFAIIQLRQIRQQRREMAAIELFRFFGSPHFTQAYRRVLELPDGLSREQLEEHTPDIDSCAMLIGTTMENIGVMMYHRIVPSSVVKDLIGNSTVVLWRKLDHWVAELRVETGNAAAFEWFEWLSIILEGLSDKAQPPAFVSCRGWKPSGNSRIS